MKDAARRDRSVPAGLVVLGLALHGPSLFQGLADRDLAALETAIVTPAATLLAGGVHPGFTPLADELHLWWWGRVAGLGPQGLHLVALGLAGVALALLHRATSRLAGPRAADLAAGLVVVFPPLGTAIASVAASGELMAPLACALALDAWGRGRFLVAGAACAMAALASETAIALPLALAALDVGAHPGDSRALRARRLLPAFLGTSAALALATLAHGAATAPSGTQWIVPDFFRAWAPAGALAGLGSLLRDAPWWPALAAAAAFAAIRAGKPARRREREEAGPSGPRPMKGNGRGGERPLFLFGLTLLALGLAGFALVPAPRGAEALLVPALGAALALAVRLQRGPVAAGRVAIAALALVSLGAHARVPDVALAAGRARFDRAGNLRAQAERTAPWLAALAPACEALASSPRTFAVGIPPDSALTLALGPGARVTCRRFVTVRFLAEMTPQEAGQPFGVLRWESRARRFVYESATPVIRARVGEGLLLFSRHETAAAAFEAAYREAPDHPELAYPLVAALAAAGRGEDAAERWRETRERSLFPSADTLAGRLTAGIPDAEQVRPSVARLAHAVVTDPTAPAPHLMLGRRLLEIGQARSATIELAVGSGISRKSQDLYWLARGYDALGSRAEALETYRVALSGGLDSAEYAAARDRLVELLREERAADR